MRLALTLVIAVACLAATTGAAHAAGCNAAYNPATHVVAIDSCSHDPDAPTIAKISRTPGGSILLNDQPIANGPTVTNTDSIVYDGDDFETDEITLDMSNGQFKPGYMPEVLGGGISEIELTIDGGTGPTNFLTILGDATETDSIAIGAGGLDFGRDGDSDLTRAHITGMLNVDGQGGRDYIFAAGFEAYGPSTAPLEIRGGAGNDLVGGGEGADHLLGGADRDVVVEHGGGFVLTDTSLTGNGSDTLAGIESATLTGGYSPDLIDATAFSGSVRLGE
jgi:hypothetical protein